MRSKADETMKGIREFNNANCVDISLKYLQDTKLLLY